MPHRKCIFRPTVQTLETRRCMAGGLGLEADVVPAEPARTETVTINESTIVGNTADVSAGGFTGGVFVATGDINGDGTDDIITGPAATGGPHVRVFDAVHAEIAFVPSLTGEVRLERFSQSAESITIAFPDVCRTPAASAVDLAFIEQDAVYKSWNASRLPEDATAQTVIVIQHADGTFEWIYDLPAAKSAPSEQPSGA